MAVENRLADCQWHRLVLQADLFVGKNSVVIQLYAKLNVELLSYILNCVFKLLC